VKTQQLIKDVLRGQS